MTFVSGCLQHSLNYLGLLPHSANLIHEHFSLCRKIFAFTDRKFELNFSLSQNTLDYHPICLSSLVRARVSYFRDPQKTQTT